MSNNSIFTIDPARTGLMYKHLWLSLVKHTVNKTTLNILVVTLGKKDKERRISIELRFAYIRT